MVPLWGHMGAVGEAPYALAWRLKPGELMAQGRIVGGLAVLLREGTFLAKTRGEKENLNYCKKSRSRWAFRANERKCEGSKCESLNLKAVWLKAEKEIEAGRKERVGFVSLGN